MAPDHHPNPNVDRVVQLGIQLGWTVTARDDNGLWGELRCLLQSCAVAVELDPVPPAEKIESYRGLIETCPH
jgi:hypothetical protein